jgi:hypothetical protein
MLHFQYDLRLQYSTISIITYRGIACIDSYRRLRAPLRGTRCPRHARRPAGRPHPHLRETKTYYTIEK